MEQAHSVLQPRLQNWSKRYWPLVFASGVLLFSICFWIFTQLATAENGHAAHLLMQIYREVNLNLFITTFGIIWLILIVVMAGRRRMVDKLIVGFLIGTATFAIMLSLFPRVFADDYSIEDSLSTENNLYYLTYTPGWLGDPGWYTLDKCDLDRLDCEVLYISEAQYAEFDKNGKLTLDDGSKIISVWLSDELMYTHPIE